MMRHFIGSYLKNAADRNLLAPKYKKFHNTSIILGLIFGTLLVYPAAGFIADICGILPDVPVREQNNGFLYIVLFLLALPILIFGGALFSTGVFFLPLLLMKKLEFREFVGLVFYSKFPPKWYKKNNT